jgi:hypothetical protein
VDSTQTGHVAPICLAALLPITLVVVPLLLLTTSCMIDVICGSMMMLGAVVVALVDIGEHSSR